MYETLKMAERESTPPLNAKGTIIILMDGRPYFTRAITSADAYKVVRMLEGRRGLPQ